jgi:hypothetical protein
MRAVVIAISLLASACVTTPVSVTGRYASRLSSSDVQQITALASSRRDLGHPLRTIVALAPGRVRVFTRREDGEHSWTGTSYFVVLRNAQWVVAQPDGFEASTGRVVTIY